MLQVLLGIGLNMICVFARLILLVTDVTNAQKASLDFHHVLQVSFHASVKTRLKEECLYNCFICMIELHSFYYRHEICPGHRIS